MEDSGSMMELLVKNRRKKSKGNTFPDREILEGKIFFHREKVEGKIFPREGKSRGFSLLSLRGKKSVIYRDFP
jgi:hypothetical protein